MTNDKNFLTITALNEYLKQRFESDSNLASIYLKGEISNFTNHKSGHFYFTLKDETGTILVYGTYSADGETRYDALTTKPVAGDKITVYGVIGAFGVTPQMKNGWITAHEVCEHNYTSTTIGATCTQTGSITHNCSICDYTYTDVIPILEA